MGSTLLSGINIGRETLMSHGSAMAAYADNVSNSNTTGFKAGLPEFADILARGEGTIGDIYRAASGDGVKLDQIKYLFQQGGIEPTGRPYDLAIDGDGFFTLAKTNSAGEQTGELYYSRAGNLEVDANGRLVNADGLLVMGFVGDDTKALQPIQSSGKAVPATATTTALMSGNLNASTATIVGDAAPDTFTSITQLQALRPFAAPVRIIDSLGTAHEATINFFKTGAGTWSARAYVDGSEVAGGTPGVPTAIGAAATITFGEDGVQTTPGTLNVTANWSNGAAASTVALDLSGFTGYSSESTVNATAQNGKMPGNVTGFAIDSKGVVSEVLSNGDKNVIGTLALARFPNVQGLVRSGQTIFSPTDDAGDVTYAAPTEDGRGSVNQGSLENSNVDLADQFISIIRVQRTYQAGSQVIKTSDELLNTTIQIA